MLEGKRIGFIGAGSMAEAIVRGLLATGFPPERILLTNRSRRERLQELQEKWGVEVTPDKAFLVNWSDILILAVKPKDMAEVLAENGQLAREEQLVLSVAAGITTRFIESNLMGEVPVVRAMPNTSTVVQESATALALGRWAKEKEAVLAGAIFRAVGQVLMVQEKDLDAVTGLSGSGPAYVYRMIEAMIEAGTQVGLTQTVARELAVQTVLGAAKMLRETGEDPAALRHRVTSPGGTTLAGLQALEERGFPAAIRAAIERATHRAGEIAAAFSVEKSEQSGSAPGSGVVRV
ncbi:MAG: pyrroline-5-carboxylate reductase [Firmicutes bacterium]|nr:pyrroline-5-carboxylate reductase [Bacillota bacterium]